MVAKKDNKINTILYERYYSEIFKAIPFEKSANNTNINNLMFQVILIFSNRS